MGVEFNTTLGDAASDYRKTRFNRYVTGLAKVQRCTTRPGTAVPRKKRTIRMRWGIYREATE